MQNPLQQFLQQPQPQPTGKVYIVASHSCCMVGIEQLTIMHVSPASQAAFLKQYAGRIIMEGSSAESLSRPRRESARQIKCITQWVVYLVQKSNTV